MLTNLERLHEAIDKSGLKILAIAEKMGISKFTLYKKLSGENDFSVKEANTLSDILGFSASEKQEIFLP